MDLVRGRSIRRRRLNSPDRRPAADTRGIERHEQYRQIVGTGRLAPVGGHHGAEIPGEQVQRLGAALLEEAPGGRATERAADR